VDWCHEHCKEWTSVSSGKARISVEQIAEALGKDSNEIARVSREARELNRLNELFAGG